MAAAEEELRDACLTAVMYVNGAVVSQSHDVTCLRVSRVLSV